MAVTLTGGNFRNRKIIFRILFWPIKHNISYLKSMRGIVSEIQYFLSGYPVYITHIKTMSKYVLTCLFILKSLHLILLITLYKNAMKWRIACLILRKMNFKFNIIIFVSILFLLEWNIILRKYSKRTTASQHRVCLKHRLLNDTSFLENIISFYDNGETDEMVPPTTTLWKCTYLILQKLQQ